jgi:hypothetical protein
MSRLDELMENGTDHSVLLCDRLTIYAKLKLRKKPPHIIQAGMDLEGVWFHSWPE